MAAAFFILAVGGAQFALASRIGKLDLSTQASRTPCSAMVWTMHVKPNVHQNLNTPWKRDQELDYSFDLPESLAGWFRAAIYEAPCPAHARHPNSTATFNCERNGEWRMTKESCTHASSDCFARTVRVETDDSFSHNYALGSGDDGAVASMPCQLGPWTVGEVHFVCKESDWHLDGAIECAKVVQVEREVSHCAASGGYTVNLNGVTAEYSLPRGEFGDRTTLPCKFGSMNEGEVTFECQDTGDWRAVGQQCQSARTAPTAGEGCRAARKRLSIAGSQQSFVLLPGELDEEVAKDCSGGLVGKVVFTCSHHGGRNRWKLTHQSCEAQ